MRIRLLVDWWRRGSGLVRAGTDTDVDDEIGMPLLMGGQAERMPEEMESATMPESETAAQVKRPRRKKKS